MSLVLIVEDEEALRVLAESIIQHHGYEALSAGTVEQACASRRRPEIRPFVTDLGLRDDLQAGLTAAQEAVKRIPGLPVLYTTGQCLLTACAPCSSSEAPLLSSLYRRSNSVPRLTTCLMPGERKKASTSRGDAMLEGERRREEVPVRGNVGSQ